MSALDQWKGEQNAQYTEQKDNAYVSKAEFDRLADLAQLRDEWLSFENNDWKAIKGFIDRNANNPLMSEFMASTEKKSAGLVSFRMTPTTYYQWKIVSESLEGKGFAEYIKGKIDVEFTNVVGATETRPASKVDN